MSAFFARRAIDLLKSSDPQQRSVQIDEIVKDLGNRRPSEAEFDEAFEALTFTEIQTSDKRVIQYILRRHYQFFSGNDAVDFDKMTIEHLLPQSSTTPSAGQLGNLIYISKELNASLEDKSFAQKVAVLKAVTTEWIPPEILEATEWGPVQIQHRTTQLATAARTRIWKL